MKLSRMRALFANNYPAVMLVFTVALTGCPGKKNGGNAINTGPTNSAEATADPKSESNRHVASNGNVAASSSSESSESSLAENTSEQSATEVRGDEQSTSVKKVGSDVPGTMDSGQPTKGSPTSSERLANTKIPSGNWTTQRLIAPTTRGPAVIDLKLQVGESDLDSASSSAMEPIAKSLLEKLETPPSWSALVELPLVKSGWLGNLTAESGSLTQLVAMYDKNKDQQVQSDELNMFLTRGLARSATVQVSDVGTESSEDPVVRHWERSTSIKTTF